MIIRIVCLVALAQLNCANVLQINDEDATLSVTEIIRKYGYPIEEYKVTTADGYILTLHRVPYGKKRSSQKDKVVLLQHGVLSSSADWIISGVHKGLAYILADEGYDVWMGNARGNKLSRNHTHLNPDKDGDYWDFSWHEIGYFDLPAMIDFILEKTAEKDLFYIGHSQGTTSFFVMASTRPEYNRKIRAQFSLAPIAYMNHMTSPLLHIIAFWQKPIELLINLIGMHEFLPSNSFINLAGINICENQMIDQLICENSLFAICGFSYKEMNATLIPILLGHTPAGSSSKQLLHFAQEVNSGYFRQYDYGFIGNWRKYRQFSPPNYNLKKISAPVYLIWSYNDWLSGAEDVYKLYSKLGNGKGRFLVADDSFNHLDYMYGINAPKLVYNKLISLMTRH